MKSEVNSYVNSCSTCQAKPTVDFATCYQVTLAPKWSQYLIDYLTTRVFPETMSKSRQRTIEVEAQNYTIIGDQLYRRCVDNELRMCATEREYISLLEQAHKGVVGGHFLAVITAMII